MGIKSFQCAVMRVTCAKILLLDADEENKASWSSFHHISCFTCCLPIYSVCIYVEITTTN